MLYDSKIEEKLARMGLSLPETPAKGGVYSCVKPLTDKVYTFSGCGCLVGDEGPRGKLGGELTLEEGQRAAQRTMLNVLAYLKANLGSLDDIASFVKVLVFVASAPDFYDQPAVANGATQLLKELFGEEIGLPTRSAVGVAVLPGNIPVEIEGVVRVK